MTAYLESVKTLLKAAAKISGMNPLAPQRNSYAQRPRVAGGIGHWKRLWYLLVRFLDGRPGGGVIDENDGAASGAPQLSGGLAQASALWGLAALPAGLWVQKGA
jgi:hypothetical protein